MDQPLSLVILLSESTLSNLSPTLEVEKYLRESGYYISCINKYIHKTMLKHFNHTFLLEGLPAASFLLKPPTSPFSVFL